MNIFVSKKTKFNLNTVDQNMCEFGWSLFIGCDDLAVEKQKFGSVCVNILCVKCEVINVVQLQKITS